MPTTILMPALSPTMEKGNLAKWLKKEGDKVKPGDVIAEIETDKATMEVEAVDEGVLARLLILAPSADVAVNTPIAILALEGEDAKAVAAAGIMGGGVAAPTPNAVNTPAQGAKTTPEKPQESHKESGQGGGEERVFASPLARRKAKEMGLDLAQMRGSGPHGRIVVADVEKGASQVKKAASAPVAAPSAAPAASSGITPPSDEMIKKLFAAGSYEEIPHDSMRRTIARRLLESKLTVPHFYLSVDCVLDPLLALREVLNKAAPLVDGKPSYKLSVNDMVIKAMAMALRAVPDANVSWTESAMLKHKHADVGVAVSIPGGLITPVIRGACHKTLSTISNEMKDLAGRAKARKLKPEEYQGGTTAISNLGMFGVKDFAAVINPPHATILAVGAGEARAIVKDGQVVVANVMSVTLSTDHRAVDGALGAQLLAAFRNYIENPMGMLV